MAIMFPNMLSDCENASEGERLVYSFLKETGRPDRDFICWYTPNGGGDIGSETTYDMGLWGVDSAGCFRTCVPYHGVGEGTGRTGLAF
jgi:hypothetical protein